MGQQRRRRFTRRFAMVCSVLLAGMLIGWLVVLGLGLAIPLDGVRNPLEAAASRALGREVRINGALSLRPTLRPTLIAHDVHIASPQGRDDVFLAGRVAIQLAPAALLRGETRGVRLLAEDIRIELDARGLVAPGEADTGVYPRQLSAGAELLVRQPELQELVLRRVVLNYRDERTAQFYPIKLDEVGVYPRPGQPLELTLRGHLQQQPYTIDLTGGRLADLRTPVMPWPVRARVRLADTRLLLNGQLEASRQGLVMPFELQFDGPAEVAEFAAHFGPAPLAGRLSLRAGQGRPVVTGELQLPALDAVLRFGGGAVAAGNAAGPSGPDGETRADRLVSVPLAVSIADVPFHGQLKLAGQGADPLLELALSATDADAGRLLATLTGRTGIRGHVQQIGLQASVHGRGATGIADRVALALQLDGAKLSYGNGAGERPVAVTLDELALSLPAGEALMMRTRGRLLDEPFAVEFTADGLEALLAEETWLVTLSATGGGAVLDISGVLAALHADTPTRLHVGLYGQRIGDLAAWLGVSACADTSYKLRGQLVLAEDLGRLQFLQVQADRTQLNGELDWSGDDQVDLLHAVLHFEELDPADIEAFIPLVNRGSDEKAGEGAATGFAFDMPVLPARVEIINADVDLVIAHVLLDPVDINAVSLAVQIREGRLQRFPFHAHIGTASFQGYLDPATAETTVVFEHEDDSGATRGGWVDKLFSSAVRWFGSSAVVPLRRIFMDKLSGGDLADCTVQGVEADD